MTNDQATSANDNKSRELHSQNEFSRTAQQQQQQQQQQHSPAKGTFHDDGCALFEMVQYNCRLMSNHVACRPVERFFRRCPGRPSVEVTHVVSTDRMGNVYLSDSMIKAMPPAHRWHEL